MSAIEIETSRRLLRTTRRRTWWAVSGFAPYVYNGLLHAGFCTVITSEPREPDPWRDWQDDGGEGG